MDFDSAYFENILNIFIKYYNLENATSINMFTGINEYEETNEIMEEFMDHLMEYKENDENIKKLMNINEINIEDYEKLYGLQIDENIICVCEIFFPIIIYIAKNIDWKNINWKIILMNTQENINNIENETQ
jgi:hypothetical protein